jgi:hypothetical protein
MAVQILKIKELIMNRRSLRMRPLVGILALAIGGLALASCGGGLATYQASPSRPATVSPTYNSAEVSALLAVADKAIPFYATLNGCPGCPKANVYADCAWVSGAWEYSHCPLSPRLRAYLQQHMHGLCRVCTQGSPARTMTAEPTRPGGVVHVALYDGLLRIDLIMVKTGGEYLVDDSVCTGGGPQTSIYNPPPDAPTPNAWTCGFAG